MAHTHCLNSNKKQQKPHKTQHQRTITAPTTPTIEESTAVNYSHQPTGSPPKPSQPCQIQARAKAKVPSNHPLIATRIHPQTWASPSTSRGASQLQQAHKKRRDIRPNRHWNPTDPGKIWNRSEPPWTVVADIASPRLALGLRSLAMKLPTPPQCLTPNLHEFLLC